jgi:transcriptional regulator with XRE-family HTH domain
MLVTNLSELLVASNRSGLSARAIARRAQERGHSLNHDTAARYLRGDHGTPDEGTLVGFADVLDVPLRALRAAANLPSEATEPYVAPIEASRLTRRQRRAVDEIIRAMLEPTASTSAAEGASVAELPARDTSSRRAARHGEPEPPDES